MFDDPRALFDIAGKSAIVIGATGSLGQIASRALAGAGANVAICGSREDALSDLRDELAAAPGRIVPIARRPDSESASDAIVKETIEAFGGVDILVVASGVNEVAPAVDMQPARFEAVLDANVTSTWLAVRSAGRAMIERGRGGKIILTSSARGKLGHPAGYTAYCASKAAVDGLVRSFGCEWGRYGITVNGLAPTVFRSPLTSWMFTDEPAAQAARENFLSRIPLGRLGEPEDLAGPILFLSAPASDFLTGHVVYPDGGVHSRMTNDIRPVCVVGGGRMGAGISQVFALAGFTVFVYEVNEQVRTSVVDRVRESLACAELDVAVADRIIITDDLSAAVADACFVTEAVGEKLELKREVFAGIAAAAPHDAILASNTSVIPISEIAAGSPAIDRIVGTHWWNPAPLIPLVEVVQATGTSVETVSRTMKLLAAIGKKPMHVRKEVPGFVGNRLQHALWREAIALVQEGVCDATTVDDVVKNSFGLRLAVLGPLENADLVGLDLTLDIHRVVVPALDCQGGPNPVLVDKVARGMLGCKTGEGFRRWSPADIAEMNNRLEGHLVRLLHPRDTGPVG